MNTTPGHPWTTRDLAATLETSQRILQSQLGRWIRAGHLTRASTPAPGPAAYAPAAPP